jgi:signal transduction histidine kinase
MLQEPRSPAVAVKFQIPASWRWWSLLVTVAMCTVMAMAIDLVTPAAGSDLWANLKTNICIPFAVWSLANFLFWISRGRLPWPAIAAIAFPLGYLVGDKVGPLLGGQDLIGNWVHARLVWPAIISTMLLATGGVIFIDRFFRAAYYRVALETERRRIAEIQRAQAVSELALLQAQIEPHFLFNTLSHVLSTVEHEPAVAKSMLEHLTSYLRGTLHRSRESEHRLGEEQDLVAALLAIAAMRLGPRLRYQICIDPSLRTLKLPPLLLQPLVENAIRHGIEPAVNGGEIRVDAERLGEDLILRVTDTGKGLTDGAPEGVGLSNVRARLTGLYGDKGRLSLFSNPAQGVIAELRLPAQHARLHDSTSKRDHC